MDKQLIKRAMQKNAFISSMVGKGMGMASKVLGRGGATRAADIGMSAARGALPGAAIGGIAGGIQGASSENGSFLGGALKGAAIGGTLGGVGGGALRGARHGAHALRGAGYKSMGGIGSSIAGAEKSLGLGRRMASFSKSTGKASLPGAFSSKAQGYQFRKAASLNQNLAQRILNRG